MANLGNVVPDFLYNWRFYTTIAEWLIRLVMLVYVPQRRSAAAARTWLLLIFFEPFLGLGLYALFGRIYYPKARRNKLAYLNASVAEVRKSLPDMEEAISWKNQRAEETANLTLKLGSFLPLGGNTTELLDDYSTTQARIEADIDLAKHHVHLLMYIYADDEAGHTMTKTLIAAAKRGVQCRVLLDALGASDGLRVFRKPLQEAGIEVVEAMPMGSFRSVLTGKSARFDLRNHRKVVIIDGYVGYIGSQNIIGKNATADLPSEELVVRTTGPIVHELQAVFLADHFLETSEAFFSQEYFPSPPPNTPLVKKKGTEIAQVLPSGPGYGTQNAQMVLVSLIHLAQKRIVMTTPYFVPDEAFLQAIHVACYRGVQVHLVLSQRLDQRFTQAAQEAYFSQLLSYGVHIYLYRPAFLHAKHVTIDEDIALIGSTNMDIRSFALNSEVALLVYDHDLVARVNVITDRYFAHSDLLSRQQWSKRPLLRRTWQNLARLADALL